MTASTPWPSVPAAEAAWLTEAQMVEVDRVMMEDLGIDLVRMMENAGRNLAQVAVERFAPRRVTVLAGSGGNGGGGMVAARHLHNRGVDVRLVTTRPIGQLRGVPGEQAAILGHLGVGPSDDVDGAVADADLLIDAVIGYALRGAPSGRAAVLIESMNASGCPVLALDTPSGLDVSGGPAPGAVVRATMTLTVAQPKVALRDAPEVGELAVADISVPPSVYDSLGCATAVRFSTSSIVTINV